VPTLRNVDKRPDPGFVKAYGHNGYFTSLKAIVHFCNTRDVLPRCQPHDANARCGVLAGAGIDRQHEQEPSRAPGPDGRRGGCDRQLHAR
jgi:cytochrome c peroxidase